MRKAVQVTALATGQLFVAVREWSDKRGRYVNSAGPDGRPLTEPVKDEHLLAYIRSVFEEAQPDVIDEEGRCDAA
jgi:hypothetical protein